MPTLAETIDKINEFAELPIGWHFGEGVPPLDGTVRKARNLVSVAKLLGVKRANAFPGARGQIQVTFYHNESVLELTLETDDSVTIAEDEGETQILFREGASKEDAYLALMEFSQKIWATSESSIESTTIRNVRTSLVRRLISQAGNLSPWLSVNVRLMPVEPFVPISGNIILSRPGSHQFTGTFPMGLFRLNASSSVKEVPLAMIATTISTVGRENKPDEPSSH